MSGEVEDREKHGRRLLHARKPPKGPFAVVLFNSCTVYYSSVGNEVHAMILAIIFACPASKSEGEG